MPGIAIEGVADPNCIPCNWAGGADWGCWGCIKSKKLAFDNHQSYAHTKINKIKIKSKSSIK